MVWRRLAALCMLPCFAHAAAQQSTLEEQARGEHETCLLQAGVRLLKTEEADLKTLELASQEGRAKDSDARANSIQRHELHVNKTWPLTPAVALAAPPPALNRELVIFVVCVAIYAVAAVVYELKTSSGGDEGSKRVLAWDSVRLLVQMSIVSGHIHYLIQLDMDIEQGKLSSPMGVFRFVSRDQDTESIMYLLPAMYRMPTFSFLSGVFGQKVDRLSMSRVVCYTYGTIVLMTLMNDLIRVALFNEGHHFPAPLWYLQALFVWRFTLSPLFSTVQNSPMYVKLALYALVSCFLFMMFDLTQSLVPAHGFYSFFGESCYLGPYFALGLLLPHRDWSNLLSNRNIQIVGVIVFALAFGSVSYGPHCDGDMGKYSDSKCYKHWPLHPEAHAAFLPSRLWQHGFWFVYKGACTFGVIWTSAAFTSAAVWVAPTAASKLLSGGERSMYNYVLHMHLVEILSKICSAHGAVEGLGTWHWVVINYSTSAFFVLVLTSRLTEIIFNRIVMPFWLLEIPCWLGLVTPTPVK